MEQNKYNKPGTVMEESKKNGIISDPNKLKQKVLSSDSLDQLPFAFDDDDILEEDEDDEKLIPNSPLSDSFILINKENLGDGSSRSTILFINIFEFIKKRIIAIKLIDNLEQSLKDLEKKGLKNDKFLKRIKELAYVLQIMQNQYNFIKEVLDSSSDTIPAIRNKYQFLNEYFINLHSKNDICFPVLEISANYIMNNILLELCHIIETLSLKFSQKKSLRYLNDLKIMVIKKYFFSPL